MRTATIMATVMLALPATVTGHAAASAQTPAAQGGGRAVPYWASIGPAHARMRTGPARTYPASWLYQRAELPLRVVAVFKEWRKVQDPDGTEGWMQATLLRSARTAIVRGDRPIAMREQPAATAKLAWRAAPGVVGRITQCGGGWCRFDVGGREGYVEVGGLWGVEAGEQVP